MPRFPRSSRGLQRVEMRKMTNEKGLLVTFSKRRFGLFKKASELCTLCGAEVLVLVFSPGNKPFSFGHPSVEALIDRFDSRNNPNLNPNPNPNHNHNHNHNHNQGLVELFEVQRNHNVGRLNMELTNCEGQLEMEKKKGDELTKTMNTRAGRCWWERPTEGFNIHELDQVKRALEKINENVATQKENIRLEGQGPSGGPYFMGACPSGGGQGIVSFHPQVPRLAQARVSFLPHAPPQGPNANLSLPF